MKEWVNLSEEDAANFMTAQAVQPVRRYLAEKVSGGSLLDVGCGRGCEVSDLYDPDLYSGVDPSYNLVSIAREQNPGYSFEVADGRQLPFKDNEFDFAICKSVLEHVPTLKDALTIYAEVRRVARVALVAWHTPPRNNPTEIIVLHGYIPDPLYQNKYDRSEFEVPDRKSWVAMHDQAADWEIWHAGE